MHQKPTQPWQSMTPEDFHALGFKCGLEIHQQIITIGKLFCRCPAKYAYGPPDAATLRHMRPTLSELGEYDGTALMEFKTRKEVVYHLYHEVTCTYEMDDTPPFMIDEEALAIAVEIALLLNCNLVDEVHVSRKQYLDGSIPTGFQRTAIIGVDGHISLEGGRKVGIIQLALEEDACREVSDVGHRITFKTDRLGFPLIEVVTAPEITDPWMASEVGWRIARLLRATGKLRRGMGSVRQDVNVSIAGGTRVEIKGVPRIGEFTPLTANEALRQKSLLDLREIIKKRGLDEGKFEVLDITNQYLFLLSGPIIERIISQSNVVKAVVAHNCAGILSHPTQPGRVLMDEIAGRVRVIACLDKMPNLLSPEVKIPGGPSKEEWARFCKRLMLAKDDALVLVWGSSQDTETAVKEIQIRLCETRVGVINETRQALDEGITDFERILPGADRMYPDTDLPPKPLSDEYVARIAAGLPEPPWEREERYKRLGLSADLAHLLSDSPRADLFDMLVSESGAPPTLVAVNVEERARWLRRQGKSLDGIEAERLTELFNLYQQGKFFAEAFPSLLLALAENKQNVLQMMQELGFSPMDKGEVERLIDGLVEQSKRLNRLDGERLKHHLMGQAMVNLRGCYPGKKLWEELGARLSSIKA